MDNQITFTITQEDIDTAICKLYGSASNPVKPDEYIEMAYTCCPVWQALTRLGHKQVVVWGGKHYFPIQIGGQRYTYGEDLREFIARFDELDDGVKLPEQRTFTIRTLGSGDPF